MNHQAIYNTHSNVVYIKDTDTGVIAKDVDGNVVELDVASVEAETTVVTTAWNLAALRRQRNRLIAETDWEIVKHKELGTNVPTALNTYRQALRDLPANTTDPANPVWPTKPGA